MHKTEHKTRGPQIQPTTKDYNDVIDVKNENIPIQKILHNPKNKTTRKEKPEPYTDIMEFKNINIEPEKEMHKIPSHTIYSA